MQNRYAGDVGDFGKLGMLRCIEQKGIVVGINWYLVENENHNQDGKHIGYLQNNMFVGMDDELHIALASMIKSDDRTVAQLETLKLLQSEIYYHETLKPINASMRESRFIWHQNALKSMNGSELVFLDPDNGLIPKSVSRGSIKSIKYAFPEEIIDYYMAGHSVVFYSHRTREQLHIYLNRFKELFEANELEGATITGITFRRGTVRDYFFLLQVQHKERILRGLEQLLSSSWNQHFEIINM